MEIVKFFFTNIWHFLGQVIVITLTLDGIADIVKAFRTPKNNQNNDND